jgi:hypothetical protein
MAPGPAARWALIGRLRGELWRVPYLLAVAASILLWLTALPGIDLRQMSDLGLISVLPPQILVAVFVLSVSMLVTLLRGTPHGVIPTIHAIALVVILFATPIIVEQLPSGTTTYLHAGFTELIARTGALATDLDARFSWPGFFVLAAVLTQLTGLGNALAFAAWAPVYFNFAFLLALWVLYRGLGLDWRLAWASVWLFELANWIGQDYFSPQALAYFLYVAILGAALTWFRVARPRIEVVHRFLRGIPLAGRLAARLYEFVSGPERAWPAAEPDVPALILVVLVVIFGFVAISHQLTPFVVVLALLGLAIMNRISIGLTGVLFGIIATAWVSYATVPFLSGHLAAMLAQIGQLDKTVSENVTSRIIGSADHQLVLSGRLAFTLSLWALAALGALIRIRRHEPVWTMLIAAVAPVPLLGLQGYGGELVLRMYLFSLPFVAVLAAATVFRGPRPISNWLERGLVFVALAALGLAFFITRYGNERSDSVTAGEFQAVQTMYAAAPPGSLLVTAYVGAWKYQGVEQFAYVSISEEFKTQNLAGLVGVMSSGRYPSAYLLLTRREESYGEMFAGLDPAAWDAYVAQVEAEPRLHLVYRNADASLWSIVRTATP